MEDDLLGQAQAVLSGSAPKGGLLDDAMGVLEKSKPDPQFMDQERRMQEARQWAVKSGGGSAPIDKVFGGLNQASKAVGFDRVVGEINSNKQGPFNLRPRDIAMPFVEGISAIGRGITGKDSPAQLYKKAQDAFAEGKATDEQLARLAIYEYEQNRNQQIGQSGRIAQSLGKAPAVVAEALVGGQAVKGLGAAGGAAIGRYAPAVAEKAAQIGSKLPAALRSNVAIGAATQAAATPLTPSLWLAEAEQRQAKNGGKLLSVDNAGLPMMRAAFQNAIMGHLGKATEGRNILMRGVIGGGMMPVEQAAADVISGAAEDLFVQAGMDKKLKTDMGYGTVDLLLKSKFGEAWEKVITEAAMGSMFAAGMGGKYKGPDPVETVAKQSQFLTEKGVPPDQAAPILLETMPKQEDIVALFELGPAAEPWTSPLDGTFPNPNRLPPLEGKWGEVLSLPRENQGKSIGKKSRPDPELSQEFAYEQGNTPRKGIGKKDQPVASPLDNLTKEQVKELKKNGFEVETLRKMHPDALKSFLEQAYGPKSPESATQAEKPGETAPEASTTPESRPEAVPEAIDDVIARIMGGEDLRKTEGKGPDGVERRDLEQTEITLGKPEKITLDNAKVSEVADMEKFGETYRVPIIDKAGKEAGYVTVGMKNGDLHMLTGGAEGLAYGAGREKQPFGRKQLIENAPKLAEMFPEAKRIADKRSDERRQNKPEFGGKLRDEYAYINLGKIREKLAKRAEKEQPAEPAQTDKMSESRAPEKALGQNDQAPPPDTKYTPEQLETTVTDYFNHLLNEKHFNTGMVPLHELRAEIAKKHGAKAASHKVFDETLFDLRRAKKIWLISISDRSKATPEQLRDGVPGVGETFMWAEKTDKTPGMSKDFDPWRGPIGQSDQADFGKPLTAEEQRLGTFGGGSPEGDAVARPDGPGKEFALANAKIDADRAEFGLPPIAEAARRVNKEVWDQAMARIAAEPDAATKLVSDLEAKPRATTVEENAMLLHRRIALSNEFERTVRRAVDAMAKGNKADSDFYGNRADEIMAEVDRNDMVARKTGTEWGRAGQFRRQLAAEDFTLDRMMMNAIRDKKAPLTEKEKAEIIALHDEIARLQKVIDAFDKDAAATGKDPFIKDDRDIDVRVAIKKPKDKYAKIREDFRRKHRTNAQKVIGAFKETNNFLRMIQTAFDLSAKFRQGGKMVMQSWRHPVRTAKATGRMLKSIVDTKFYERTEMKYRVNRKHAELGEQAGLYLADDSTPTGQEEAFVSRLSGKIPGIAASQRGFNAYLNSIRADAFDAHIDTLTRDGKPTIEEAVAIANYVNASTGRGKLPFGMKTAENVNQAFFSFRYLMSRLQILSGEPLVGGSWRTRKIVAKEYAKSLVGLGLFYATVKAAAGDDVEITFDPRSSDFGKLKFGNTRVDPLAGLSQLTSFLYTVGSGEKKALGSGEVYDIRGPKSNKNWDVTDVVAQFLRNKSSPLVGEGLDQIFPKYKPKGKGLVSELTGSDKKIAQIADKLLPFSFNDVYDAMKEQGLPRGTILSLLAILGMGTQLHDQKATK